MELINTRVSYVVQEAVVVMKVIKSLVFLVLPGVIFFLFYLIFLDTDMNMNFILGHLP